MLKRCLTAALALFWLSVGAHAACDLDVDQAGTLPGNTLIANINEELACLDAAIAAGVADGDKGDITVSSSGTVWSVDSGAVGVTELSGLGTGVGTFLGTPSSANLATAITDETGSGALVFGTSPSLTTPNLGTPSAVTLTNGTGLPIAGITGLGTGVGTWLGTPSSANLRGASTDEVGTGPLMFGLAPTMADDLSCTGSQVVRRNAGDTAFECATVSGGSLGDGDYGDITVSGSGTVMSIDNDTVGEPELDLVTGNTATNGDCLVARPSGTGGTLEFTTCPGAGGGISNVVEDLTPQLGGNLDLNSFAVGAATAGDLTKLNALTATSTELNYVDGVTSAIQTQIDGKQASDADLNSWAGVTRASGFDTFAATASSANLRLLLSDEVGTGAAYFVGGALGTPASGTATNLTGLPLSTGVAGQLPLANGGTGANLTDPNADRIMFWDDSAGAVTWLTAGSGLSISGTTITATGGGASADVQTFNSSGTWNKPSGNLTMIECVGGGGSGARRTTGNVGGGGGGSYTWRLIPTASLGATETVTIGAGGAAITTGDTDGNVGGTTTFGAWLSAYGGGGGDQAAANTKADGGGGAGAYGEGGTPGGGAVGGITGLNGGNNAATEGGGASGGSVTAGNAAAVGGNAHKGGAGGGAASATNTTTAGGGSNMGGAGGASSSSGAATAGSQPGGGGGGGRGVNSGAGGDGRCIATTF